MVGGEKGSSENWLTLFSLEYDFLIVKIQSMNESINHFIPVKQGTFDFQS